MSGIRLADGASAVANTEAYVRACVGAREAAGHPGLTGDGIREWYGAEEGLSLGALEADSAALAEAGSVAAEALAEHRAALAVLNEGWAGGAGSAAACLLSRHCGEASEVVAALHSAAAELASLRDKLGQLVDEKVEAAIRIDDRRAAERPAWLAHVRSALDDADPEALQAVRREIAPYVASDIQADWMAAMRSATESVGGAYEQAGVRLSDRPAPGFESLLASPAATAPATAWPPPQPPASWPAWPSGVPAPAAPGPAASGPPGVLPAVGGAVGGLIAQVAEALGPYAGSSADLPAESLDRSSGQSDPGSEAGPVDKPVERPRGGEVAVLEPDGSVPSAPIVPAPAAIVEQPDVVRPDGRPPEGLPHSDAQPQPLLAAERPPEPGVQTPAGAPPPPGTAQPSQLPPPAEAEAGRSEAAAVDAATPCEIAAEELPQVGR